MPWVRIDENAMEHPKISGLPDFPPEIVAKSTRGAILIDPMSLDSPSVLALSDADFRECIRLMCALNRSTAKPVQWRSRRMLEKLVPLWGRACSYCGAAGCALEVEHMVPLSRGGADALENMAIACRTCNQRKGTKTPEEFGLFPIARL